MAQIEHIGDAPPRGTQEGNNGKVMRLEQMEKVIELL
jgi:hypothetical protein